MCSLWQFCSAESGHSVRPLVFARIFEAGSAFAGPLIGDLYHRAASYVDKILKGRKPANLSVKQPMKFEFIGSLKTARQIGVTIPPNVLARADRVIKIEFGSAPS